jgi:hypothetical protein
MAHSSRRWSLRAVTLLVAAGAALAGWAPAANAATTATVGCSTRTSAQKFRTVDGDSNYYFTAPAGTFESGAPGWSLTNTLIGWGWGNEPYHVNGPGSTSLFVNSAGSALSPIFCNRLGESSLRFFYAGSTRARVHLHIDATSNTGGNLSTLDWEMTVPANGGWAAANGIQMPDLYNGNYENVQLRFTALNGWVMVDDVEIDPWRSL